jgi:hypothetical protein
MRLPIFFQKSFFSFDVTGLPAIGKKLILQEDLIHVKVERPYFRMTFTPQNLTSLSELQTWIRETEEKIEFSSKSKCISNNSFIVEYFDRRGLDELLNYIFDRNGGIANNTSIPEAFCWNKDLHPILISCNKSEMRVGFYTSEGRWYIVFASVDEKRTMEKKYPEDFEKIKGICKKIGIEIYPVAYLSHMYEMSKEDWKKLTEYLLV